MSDYPIPLAGLCNVYIKPYPPDPFFNWVRLTIPTIDVVIESENEDDL